MNLLRFFYTVKNFQPDQIRQKVVYEMLRKKAGRNKIRIPAGGITDYQPVLFTENISFPKSYYNGMFCFSRKRKNYSAAPDWNDMEYGDLWNIRLNSFDYLRQPDMDMESGYLFMRHFAEHAAHIHSTYDSHCVSQRILNWIPFISQHNITEESILNFLYAQATYLASNPEYHLRNNHLLDNGFALIRAALFYKDESLFSTGQKILQNHLPSQVLSDGGHIERSPMYHCIVLLRLIETVDAIKKYAVATDQAFTILLEQKVALMCSWLLNIGFDCGELPNVHDSADYMPSWPALFQYADKVGIRSRLRALGASGFRKFRNRHFELLIDLQGVSSAYSPGHSHASALHFILHAFGAPFILDTGVSTYENGPDRLYERSTRAHNTVVVGGKNQSEVYGSFRVGRKAVLSQIQETRHSVAATHNGYLNLGVLHHRRFEFQENQILIQDKLEGYKQQGAAAFFHVHKKCGLRIEGNRLISKFVTISFEGADQIRLCDSWYSPAFGVKIPAWEVRVDFSGSLSTRIALS